MRKKKECCKKCKVCTGAGGKQPKEGPDNCKAIHLEAEKGQQPKQADSNSKAKNPDLDLDAWKSIRTVGEQGKHAYSCEPEPGKCTTATGSSVVMKRAEEARCGSTKSSEKPRRKKCRRR